MRTTRFLFSTCVVLCALVVTTGSAAALSCLAPPDDLAEITITGDVPEGGWMDEPDVPVVVGRVIEGTGSQPESPGDRLALVEVIGGLRLNAVPTEVEIVADDLMGWGHPTYTGGEHLFLRIDEWNVVDGDLAGGIADGPCSWNGRYTAAEIESLLSLAEDHDVPIVFPIPVVDDDHVDDQVDSTTTAPPITGSPDDPVDDAPPTDVTDSDEDADADADDDEIGASVPVLIGAIVGLALMGGAAFFVSSRR